MCIKKKKNVNIEFSLGKDSLLPYLGEEGEKINKKKNIETKTVSKEESMS